LNPDHLLPKQARKTLWSTSNLLTTMRLAGPNNRKIRQKLLPLVLPLQGLFVSLAQRHDDRFFLSRPSQIELV